MRISLATSMAVGLTLIACGCSTVKMPSLPKLAKSKSTSKENAAQLTNAPLAPQFQTTANNAPAVSVPNQPWTSLPVYPGTNYPQTPYPDQQVAGTYAPPHAPYAAPAYDPAAAYAPQHGAMPPSGQTAGAPANPYGPYPGTAPQVGAYAAQQVPYGQPASPYGSAPPQAAAPYAPPAHEPYPSTAPPYTANPYGGYTR